MVDITIDPCFRHIYHPCILGVAYGTPLRCVHNTPATFLLVQLKFLLVEIFLTSNIINKETYKLLPCYHLLEGRKPKNVFVAYTGQFGSTDLKVPLSLAIIIFSRSYVYIFSFHRKIYLYDNLKHLIFPFWN